MWRPILTLPLAMALAGCLGEAPYERRVSWVPEDRCITPDCSDHTSLTGRGKARARFSSTELPSFDIKATCHASVTFQSSEDDRYCLADERAAEKQIRAQWASFQPAERQSCVEQSASLQPSYVETLTCLEMSKETKTRAKASAKLPGAGVDVPAATSAPPSDPTPAAPPPAAVAPGIAPVPPNPAPPDPTPQSPAPPAPAATAAPSATNPAMPDVSPRPEPQNAEPTNGPSPDPWPGLEDAPKAEPPR